jgi:katanin p80 WD40 repeat-containing subunit B1
VYPKNINIF